jgi:serine/threonine-protein kinase
LLHRCLDKDAHSRLRDIGEARIAIDGAPMAGGDEQEGVAAPVRGSWKRTLALGLGAAVFSGAVAAVGVWLAMQPTPPRVSRLSVIPSASAPISGNSLAISPDGTRVVYVAAGSSQLSMRAIDELEPDNLADLGSPRQPFISPDGQWIGFFDSVNALKTVAMTGGAGVTVCSLGGAAPRGGSWSHDGWIIYGTDDPATGLWRVPASGGEPELLTTPVRGQGDHWWPQFLPGGRKVLLTIRGGRAGGRQDPQAAVLDLESREIKPLLPGYQARYVPTGHLVYGISESLRAVAFDLEQLEVVGAPVLVQERVARTRNSAMAFAVAEDGTLVYVAGEMQGSTRRLVWVDRQGDEELLTAPPSGYVILRLSPDGTKVAIDNRETGADIWIWDIEREAITRFTFTGAPYPVWTPDGKRIVFSSFESGTGNLAWRVADSSAPLELLSEGPNSRYASSFSPDGAYLVFREEGRPTGLDIMILEMEGDRQAELLLGTEFNELNAEISPDGQWLAYKSNESARDEVYVRPFPNVEDGLWQITTDGGAQPAWARNGRELFYRAPDGALMSVPVELQPIFSAGTPSRILEGSYYLGGPGRSYDVSPDGERFLMITGGDESRDATSPRSIVVVQNWFEDLLRLAPVGQ